MPIPPVGFGCWKLDTPQTSSKDAVYDALKSGYRHIDSACDYGNEEKVGQGIAKFLSEGAAKREDLWITSKLWNTDHAKDDVEAACRRTMKDLGVDYLDLYLIHFPIALKHVDHDVRYPPEWIHDPNAASPRMEGADVPIHETWEAMENLVAKGLVKNIGVCNFNAALLMELLKSAKIKPSVNQIELHPALQQNRLIEFCKGKDIQVVAFSPLGSSGYVSIDMDKGSGVGLLQDPQIIELGKKHGKTAAQVILRWNIQRGCCIIPKSSTIARMKENLSAKDFVLDEEDMAYMSTLERNCRYNDPGVFCVGMGGDYPIWD
jgi:D-xylose reductase